MPETELLLNFKYGTQSGYDQLGTYDEGTLYFTTDTLALYKGAKLYNGGVKVVAELPTTPAMGVLYILSTTWVGQVWTGTAWKVITKPFVETIGETVDHTSVPTTKAVKDYVTGAIANVTGGTGLFVTDITYDTTNNVLVSNKGGVTSNISITGMVHDATYDTTSRKVTMPIIGGTAVEFTIPEDRDLVVKAGKYNPATEEIWLSIDPTGAYTNESNVVKIPVADLIDEIEVANTNTIALAYDKATNTITGNVVISQDANNAVKDQNGLFVDISGKVDKITGGTVDDFVQVGADGTIADTGFFAVPNWTDETKQSAEAKDKDGVKTLFTRKAIEDYHTNVIVPQITTAYTNATNYTNSTNAAMKTYVDDSIAAAMKWKTF